MSIGSQLRRAYYFFQDVCVGSDQVNDNDWVYDNLDARFPGVAGFLVRAITWLFVGVPTFLLVWPATLVLAMYHQRSFVPPLRDWGNYTYNFARSMYLYAAKGIRTIGIWLGLVAPPGGEVTVIHIDFWNHDVAAVSTEQLVANRESAMVGLTADEQARLEEATNRYQPKIDSLGGVETVLTQLRDKLKNLYQAQPATITHNGVAILLPLEWDVFQKMKLTGQQKEDACKAYYQHSIHTALRFLTKPNKWISDRALFACRNADATEFWSSFESYKPLIAMLSLAAEDKEIPDSEGITVEGRFNQFIRELAHINRGHNWDKTRLQGSKLVEYDDLEGDKPICRPGTKRPLFQSIIGHPLFTITKDMLQQEINGFVLEHFEKCCKDGNQSRMRRAWKRHIEDPIHSSKDILKEWDISEADQAAFNEKMLKNTVLAKSTDLKKQLAQAFQVNEKMYGSHLEKFYGSANLAKLWENNNPLVETSTSDQSSDVKTVTSAARKYSVSKVSLFSESSVNESKTIPLEAKYEEIPGYIP